MHNAARRLRWFIYFNTRWGFIESLKFSAEKSTWNYWTSAEVEGLDELPANKRCVPFGGNNEAWKCQGWFSCASESASALAGNLPFPPDNYCKPGPASSSGCGTGPEADRGPSAGANSTGCSNSSDTFLMVSVNRPTRFTYPWGFLAVMRKDASVTEGKSGQPWILPRALGQGFSQPSPATSDLLASSSGHFWRPGLQLWTLWTSCPPALDAAEHRSPVGAVSEKSLQKWVSFCLGVFVRRKEEGSAACSRANTSASALAHQPRLVGTGVTPAHIPMQREHVRALPSHRAAVRGRHLRRQRATGPNTFRPTF